ncbi:MAG TPA: hypothetical protein VFX49_08995 [Chloroflexota bacterium]|nr:hypothetical protein [Chloroflexota bacterium]
MAVETQVREVRRDPEVAGPERPERPERLEVRRDELETQLRRVHDGALQEVATLRVALTVWARAADAGDLQTARGMVAALRDASDRLLDELGALQAAVSGWLEYE